MATACSRAQPRDVTTRRPAAGTVEMVNALPCNVRQPRFRETAVSGLSG